MVRCTLLSVAAESVSTRRCMLIGFTSLRCPPSSVSFNIRMPLFVVQSVSVFVCKSLAS